MFNKIIYFGYYLKSTNWKEFRGFVNHVQKTTGRSRPSILQDVMTSSFKYKIAFIDYFYFRFYEKDAEARKSYAGTGYMYEYQLKMNPRKYRDVLNDKWLFLKHFSKYIHHAYFELQELKKDPDKIKRILEQPQGKFVIKARDGQCGREVRVFGSKDKTPADVLQLMELHGLDLLEEYLVQHQDLRRLSDSGLNTVRVFTQLDESGNVHILGVRLRITVNSHVDNLAAGNLAAPVDDETGIVTGPAVYSNITKNTETHHPITGTEIVGFQIPCWQALKKMVTEAATDMVENRSIGWDVVVTDSGPELLEGNHNWCKLLWQLPVQRGLKKEIEGYL
ncbi:MAG: sugar-transfer associated ATP-grasp domain-containing protein [Bacteroidia bacterium]